MFQIQQPGAQTQIQDLGRPGHRHLGLPGGGAADPLNFSLANWLAGNPLNTPALECALGGLSMTATTHCTIVITGAECSPVADSKSVDLYTPIPLQPGSRLTLGPARLGVRSYIAVTGGFSAQSFLGSAATYSPAKIGGLNGRNLKLKDRLSLDDAQAESPRKLPAGYRPFISNHIVLRARSSIEYEALSPESQRDLFTAPFTASRITDRMGARLDGATLSLKAPLSLNSGPLLPGTLQVPPSGQGILTLADGHCTGGYARALHVIRADQWLLGQIGPGTRVSFNRCLAHDAPKILSARFKFWTSLMNEFVI